MSEVLADAVVGTDALSPPAAWQRMRRAVRNVGYPGVASSAISAVDIALWDLKARLLGVALSTLLGRVRERVPVYGSGGFTSYTPQQMERQLAGWVEQGISSVKMKVGSEPDQDPQRVRHAREVIGEDAGLFVDANGAYSRKQALALAEMFAGEAGVAGLRSPSPPMIWRVTVAARPAPGGHETSPPASTGMTSSTSGGCCRRAPWTCCRRT